MRIIINGRTREMETGTSLADLILSCNVKAEGAIVVLNDAVVAEEAWARTMLAPDDRAELLSLVAGG